MAAEPLCCIQGEAESILSAQWGTAVLDKLLMRWKWHTHIHTPTWVAETTTVCEYSDCKTRLAGSSDSTLGVTVMESQRFPGFTRLRQRTAYGLTWNGADLELICLQSAGDSLEFGPAVRWLLCLCESCGGETCDRSRSKVYTAALLTSWV